MALIIALVGPLFVDWTSYRAAFEREASLALGQPVRVLGEADMQILPLPHLQFQTVHVGANEQAPLLVVDEFDVRIELMPLIKGKIDVVDMRLKAPRLRLELDEAGQLDWHQTAQTSAELDPAKIRLNDVSIENGSVLLLDRKTGRQASFSNLNGSVEARTLRGPYKIDSSLLFDGQPYSLQISTGSIGASGLRVKSLLTPANHPVTLSMDGKLNIGEDGGYHYVGPAVLTNKIGGLEDGKLPWEVRAASDLSVSKLDFSKIELDYGSADQAYRLAGRGSIDWSEIPRFDLSMASRQLDLDRTLGQGPNAPVDLKDGLAKLSAAIANLPQLPLRGRIGFDVPGVILSGGILRNVGLDAEMVDNGWRIHKFEADLPGYSFMSLQGLFSRRAIGDLPAQAFEGEIRLRSDQPQAFAKWWLKDMPKTGRLEPFDLSGQLMIKPERLSVDRIDLTLGDDRATGRIDLERGSGEVSSTLTLALKADQLDLDVAQGIGVMLLGSSEGEAASLARISLDIEARQLSAAEFTGKGFMAKLALSKGALDIETLALDDFAGAFLQASGKLTDLTGAPKGKVAGQIRARDLSGLAQLVKRLLPDHQFSYWLDRSKAALAPIDLSYDALGEQEGQGLRIVVDGELGGGSIALKSELQGALSDWASVPLTAELAMKNAKGQKLLGLLGIGDAILPLPAMAASASIKGNLADEAQVELVIAAPESELRYQGTANYKQAIDLAFDGAVSLQSKDLAPFFLSAGIALLDAGHALPLSLKADLKYEDEKLALEALSGQWSSQPVRGNLSYETTVTDRLIAGSLDLGDLDAIWLAETVLGSGRLLSMDPSKWSDLAFDTPRTGLPTGLETKKALPIKLDLDVKGRSLELLAPYIFQQPAFSLVWRPQELVIKDFTALLSGGQVKGGLQLENVDGEVAIKTHMTIDAMDLSPFVWQTEGRAVADGQMDVAMTLESQGRSMAGLVSGLSGNGTFALQEARLRYLNPQAFELVVRAVDAGLALEEADIAKAFLSHMDAGSTQVSKLDGTFRVAGGAVRANNIKADAEILKSRGNVVLDLSANRLRSDWSIEVEPAEEDAVTGATPEVGLIFAGPLAKPDRKVDVSPFTGYLNIRAFEKEVERVEKLQADILEKERMRRLLKLYRQQAKQREQDRLAAEAAVREAKKRAAEEAARKATEDARRKEAERRLRRLELERQKKQEEERLRQERLEQERKAREELLRRQLNKQRPGVSEQNGAPRKVVPWKNPDDIEIRPLEDLNRLQSSNTGSITPPSEAEQIAKQYIVLPAQINRLPQKPAIVPKQEPVFPATSHRPSYNQLIEQLKRSPDRIIQLD